MYSTVAAASGGSSLIRVRGNEAASLSQSVQPHYAILSLRCSPVPTTYARSILLYSIFLSLCVFIMEILIIK